MKIRVTVISLVILVGFLCFMAGVSFQKDQWRYESSIEHITVEKAVIWLDRAAYSHQIAIRNGDNVEFNQGCIDRYASIKELLIELGGE